MASLVLDLVSAGIENESFRRVVRTLVSQQVTVSSLDVNQDIGRAPLATSQVFIVVAGEGVAEVGNESFQISPGVAVMVSSGVNYNIRNTSDQKLKLYGIHSPPVYAIDLNLVKKPDDLPGCACDN